MERASIAPSAHWTIGQAHASVPFAAILVGAAAAAAVAGVVEVAETALQGVAVVRLAWAAVVACRPKAAA